MSEAILIANTDGTPTSIIGAVDTLIYPVNIKPTTYPAVKAEFDCQITTTGSSLTNTILIKLKLNGITLTQWNYKPVSEVRLTNQHFSFMADGLLAGNFSVGGPLTVTINASTTDAATVFTCLNMYVYAIG